MLRPRLRGKPWGKGPPGGRAWKGTKRPAEGPRFAGRAVSSLHSGLSVPLCVGPGQACPPWYFHRRTLWVTQSPLSALRWATAPHGLVLCVCRRSHPCTCGAHTCMPARSRVHTSMHTHAAHTCTHLLLPPRFAFAPWPLGGRL